MNSGVNMTVLPPAHCSRCDAALPPGSPAGHCPRCLLHLTLSPMAEPPVDEAEAPWTTFGGLELFEEIGRGGMGVVYRARQMGLDRTVAVKVLLRAKFASAEERERFHREAQAAARLKHPGIVGVLDVGEDEGLPWFSMELVAGKSLEQLVREHPMEAHEAARCVQQVAQAIQHAHEHHVLHRDLKPSNILMDIDGSPRITDFGIARIVGGDTTTNRNAHLTRTGQSLGSPGYAAPEQALHGQADARTDVYGLGALLYHLLTGRPPFQGPTLEAILVQVRENDPLSPRRLNPTVPRDLETICLKCLRKQPESRYATAADVADDLNCFLEGKPILARPTGAPGKLWRWARRHPGIAALLLIISFLTAGIIGGSLQVARHQAQLEHRAALLSEARTLRQTRVAGSRNEALQKLLQAWAIEPSTEIRNEAVACLALPELGHLRQGTATPLNDPLRALDDTGQRVASATPGSGELRILSKADGRLLFTCSHPLPISSVDWSGDLIATGCENRFIYIWNDKGELKHRLSGHQSTPVHVAFRPRSQELASTSRDIYVRLWHAARGEEILRRELDHQPHSALWWSADGKILHAAIGNGRSEDFPFDRAPALDLLTPTQEEPHTENLGSAHLSADGTLAVVSDEQSARVWDFHQGRLVHEIAKPAGQWLIGRFSPDARHLWLCGWSHEFMSYPVLRDEARVATLGPPGPPLFGPGNLLRDATADGSQIVLSNNALGEFIIGSLSTGAMLRLKHPGTLSTVIDPLGRWLITTSYQTKGARVWSLPEGKLTRTLCKNDTVMQTVLLGGERLIVQTSGQSRVFRTTNWREERTLPDKLRLTCMTASSDGTLLAILGDNDIRLHETRSFAEMLRLTLPAHVGWLGECHLVFDADASHLLVHTALGSAARWDLHALRDELQNLGMAAF